MKPIRAVLLFVAMSIVGFFSIAAAWIAYASTRNYFDREGATGMAVIFVIAPAGGLLIGFISVVFYLVRAARRPR